MTRLHRTFLGLLFSMLAVSSTMMVACGDDGPTGRGDLSRADLGAGDLLTSSDLACEGTGGCFACPPATDPQFLNACTSSSCSKFDNAARLPLLKADGTLPPLP